MQLPASQADDLLCALIYLPTAQAEFQPLPVGSGFCTADIQNPSAGKLRFARCLGPVCVVQPAERPGDGVLYLRR